MNLAHVRDVRRRASEADWELKLAPPVNKVRPVGRNSISDLRAGFAS